MTELDYKEMWEELKEYAKNRLYESMGAFQDAKTELRHLTSESHPSEFDVRTQAWSFSMFDNQISSNEQLLYEMERLESDAKIKSVRGKHEDED